MLKQQQQQQKHEQECFISFLKQLDLKGTECFLKNWNFYEGKFNFLIIRVFIILNYFSFKKI